ncbi:MAG: hypothetical protein RIC03_07650 [Cyclobacteriaceae bacterium]
MSRTLKNLIIILAAIVLFSCERTPKELRVQTVEAKYLQEFPNSEDYQDSLCIAAIELAKSRAENDVYRLYYIPNSMDTSDTPTHILMYELDFKVLGEYEKEFVYRYCYNEATFFYFNKQKGFSAREYMTNKYDSLYQLGLTQEPPKFNGGDPLETLEPYFYCNMDLEGTEPGSVTVYLQLDSIGKAHVKLVEPTGHSLDSVTLKLFQNMPLWTPGRRANKEKYRPYDYTFNFDYDAELVEKHCI